MKLQSTWYHSSRTSRDLDLKRTKAKGQTRGRKAVGGLEEVDVELAGLLLWPGLMLGGDPKNTSLGKH